MNTTLLDKWAAEDAERNDGQQNPSSGVRFALEATPDLDAQKAARISELSKSLGLPENFVIENPRKAEMEATARKLESNSLLASWASEDRLNTAMAKNDPALGEAMSLGQKVGHVWDRETGAVGTGWEKGQGQRQQARLGDSYLAALGRGDNEAAAQIMAESDALNKRLNPLWEQESFGLLKPGNLPFISQPLPGRQAAAGPPQQDLTDIFSAPPHVVQVGDKAVLLPSLDDKGQPVSEEQAAELFRQSGQHAGIFTSQAHAQAFLAEKPKRQREIAANWRDKPEDSWVSKAGLDLALEQGPRMVFDQYPVQIRRAAEGALLGGGTALALGQAGPQAALPEEIVTVPAGAAVGGKIGWSLGAGEAAFYPERNSFALELGRERDANGQPLAPQTIIAAANTYGLLSAAVETGSEAFFLSMLKPLGVTHEGLRGFLRSAVKRAAFDKKTGMALLDAGLRLGASTTNEGIEEGVQESVGILVKFLAEGAENQALGKEFNNELFTSKNAAQIWEAAKGGAVAGFWMTGGPVVVSTALDVRSGRMAQAYADNLMNLYDRVEASSTKQLSPAHMQSALEFSGEAMREHVAMPADAMLELYQSGTDLISPLGFTEEQVTKAAAQGQDFMVPVAKLPAYLDRQQMEAATRILRRVPEAMSATEAASLDGRVAQDAAKVVELYQSQAAELDAMGQEKERLRQSATAAILGNPGLRAQVESLAGGVDQYVNDWTNTLERYALRMTAAGQSPAETFRRVAFQRTEDGGRRTEGGGQKTGVREQVTGKLAPELDQKLRILERQMNEGEVGFKAGKAGVRRVIEKVRAGKKLTAKQKEIWKAIKEATTLYQPTTQGLNWQFGQRPGLFSAPDIQVTTLTGKELGADRESIRSGATTLLNEIRKDGKPLTNADTGWDLVVSRNDWSKLAKDGNRTTAELQALAGLPALVERAVLAESHPDAIHNNQNVQGIHRLYAPVEIDGQMYRAKLTVKDYAGKDSGQKTNLHALEAVEIENAPLGTSPALDTNAHEPAQPTTERTVSIADLLKDSTRHDGSAWANDGQTFRQGNQSPRGSVQIHSEGYLISLFQNADLSTLLHETGHVFIEEMERVVHSGAADEPLRRDYDTLRNWLGAETGVPLSVEQREQIARGFESYLMEGKAPAEELNGAFARFRRWLMKVYESARLNVELTDEVRGVFDRMIATEREIATTAARNELLDLTAKELDSLGFTGTARATAAGLMPKARDAAAESLRQARDENRKQRLAKYQRESLDELREEPVHRARADMRKTPLDLQAVRDNYGDEVAETLRKKHPGGLKNEDGVDPEIFAAEHGFESGAAMVAQLADAPSLTEAVKQRVAEKEAQHDAAYEAFEHLLNTREVSVQMEMVGRKLSELLNMDHIERAAYTLVAQRELAAMPLGRAMQTGNFLATMRRALRQERAAISAGDQKTALDAHRKAMLNMEFVRQSREIARRQSVVERQVKRFIGMAKGDPDARFIVMDIGMRHGLTKYSVQLAEGRDSDTMQSWLKAAEADGYSVFVDDRVLFGPGKPWREMSVADFEALAETVNQIVTVERNRRQVTTAKGKQDLQDAADAIASSIYDRRDPKTQKTVEKRPAAVKTLSGLHAIHTKIESLCVALDGDSLGAAWEYIFKPINDANDRQGYPLPFCP